MAVLRFGKLIWKGKAVYLVGVTVYRWDTVVHDNTGQGLGVVARTATRGRAGPDKIFIR